jgi:negative regulator of flagellin synthesis FlgM
MINSIHGIQPPAAPQPIEPTEAIARSAPASEPLKVFDTVEISAVARLAAKVQEIPEIRTELVERVKAELAAGTYETSERLEIAVDRLVDELFPYL